MYQEYNSEAFSIQFTNFGLYKYTDPLTFVKVELSPPVIKIFPSFKPIETL